MTSPVHRFITVADTFGDASASTVERAALQRQTGLGPLQSPQARTAKAADRRNPIVLLAHGGTDGPILPLLAEGMASALEGSKAVFALQQLNGSADEMAAFLDLHRPAGVVLAPGLRDAAALADVCHARTVSCIRLGAASGEDGFSCDERDAAATLVRQIIALGHSRVGLVAGQDGSASAARRELGYMDAIAEQGLDRGPILIVPGDGSFESGIAAGRLLLEISPRPTAIFACNDEMAAGVLHAAAQAGIAVPAGLSVAGFDDTPLAARTLPALTTVEIPWPHIARQAVRHLARRAPANLKFDAKIVMRDSVQPPG
ncbi:substrate-binding domain-containing protein [Novosphingobium sp. Leaf2]|uniref:substrate-binding domain-containing protein n=1 Tax=Novosphingobium sp. Leaf2 TaxID=1735670 RepID=UPI0006F6B531|nr:substrate-binding domain-containing protein [Novosphingobium sp. Leaf2]KQM13782.1 hypothetical protein ASE49_12000 [Novosphingobium sp. Leaf2]